MGEKRNPSGEKEFEKAIAFVVSCVRDKNRGSKPLIIG